MLTRHQVQWIVNRIESWDQDLEGFPPLLALLESDFIRKGLGDEDQFEQAFNLAEQSGFITREYAS